MRLIILIIQGHNNKLKSKVSTCVQRISFQNNLLVPKAPHHFTASASALISAVGHAFR